METVNKVVDAGYKAIWGDTTNNDTQTTATGSSNNDTNLTSLGKVVDAGKKAIWGSSGEENTTHGEEPVSGVKGMGTPTDPYDAGNRDEQPLALPVEVHDLPSTSPTAEQRNVEMSHGTSSGTATTPDLMKTTISELKTDPSGPGNATESPSKPVLDAGPGQSLKHTSEPFQNETEKLARDLENDTAPTKASRDSAAKPNAVVGAAPTSAINDPTSKPTKEDTKSSSSGSSSDGNLNGKQGQKQKKTSKLEKMKNKLHIGHHSPKASK